MHLKKISSCGEKCGRYFENRRNAEFCIVFNSQGKQKHTLFISPAFEGPILIRMVA